ncbi:MAG: sulfurtransferase [Acidimicrobiia bacterium]|nr:sulfurtransferase [Acidimicrobiia bacterium]
MAAYAHPDALVETDWLADRPDDPNLRVVEVDEDTTAYEKGHIRNSIGWNWFDDLHDKPRREYVDQESLSTLLQRAGVGPETTVILYGGNNNWFAAYAYWLLRYLGFDNVKLLNGGRKKWELESRELVDEVPSFESTKFKVPGKVRDDLRALRDEVLQKIGKVQFVDVRSPEEYRGELLAPAHLPQEQAKVGGHIPGAANVPWSRAANEDGTFKPADELKELYEDAGVKPGKGVIAYCRIGERSAHTWFVLTQLLGYDDVENYDGSWTEYGSLVGVPVEQ